MMALFINVAILVVIARTAIGESAPRPQRSAASRARTDPATKAKFKAIWAESHKRPMKQTKDPRAVAVKPGVFDKTFRKMEREEKKKAKWREQNKADDHKARMADPSAAQDHYQHQARLDYAQAELDKVNYGQASEAVAMQKQRERDAALRARDSHQNYAKQKLSEVDAIYNERISKSDAAMKQKLAKQQKREQLQKVQEELDKLHKEKAAAQNKLDAHREEVGKVVKASKDIVRGKSAKAQDDLFKHPALRPLSGEGASLFSPEPQDVIIMKGASHHERSKSVCSKFTERFCSKPTMENKHPLNCLSMLDENDKKTIHQSCLQYVEKSFSILCASDIANLGCDSLVTAASTPTMQCLSGSFDKLSDDCADQIRRHTGSRPKNRKVTPVNDANIEETNEDSVEVELDPVVCMFLLGCAFMLYWKFGFYVRLCKAIKAVIMRSLISEVKEVDVPGMPAVQLSDYFNGEPTKGGEILPRAKETPKLTSAPLPQSEALDSLFSGLDAAQARIAKLEAQKRIAIAEENFDEAKRLKSEIVTLRSAEADSEMGCGESSLMPTDSLAMSAQETDTGL